jgi:hypothetical protein
VLADVNVLRLRFDPASRGFDVDVGSAPDIIALIAGCGGITLRRLGSSD